MQSLLHEFEEELANQRLDIHYVKENSFQKGFSTPREVITSYRYILVVEGRINYEFEGRVASAVAGQILWIPAWSRRKWFVGSDDALVQKWVIIRPSFTGRALEEIYRYEASDFRLELASFERVRRALSAEDPAPLLAEAELKAMLARFARGAMPVMESGATEVLEPNRAEGTREVRRCERRLRANFHHPQAIDLAMKGVAMNSDYFRRLFKRVTRFTLHQYLARIRMQHARYLLHETTMRIGEISNAVGIEDARYFSRLYARFWNRAPSHDRESGVGRRASAAL